MEANIYHASLDHLSYHASLYALSMFEEQNPNSYQDKYTDIR